MHELHHRLSLLSDGNIDGNAVEHYFHDISVTLLHSVKIIAPHDEFVIREVEWYYYNPAIDHCDEYCHRRPRQSTFGHWYFHRYGKDPLAFLRVRRNGIDITFGNGPENIYGGILLRSIESFRDKKVISGINKVMRTLVAGLNVEQLHYLATSFRHTVFDTSSLLHLCKFNRSELLPITITSRIGLAEPQNDCSKRYYHKRYRYCTL